MAEPSIAGDRGQGAGAAGLLDDDDWDSPPRVPGIPVLHLDGYDGPLDHLLDLAQRGRIDLGGMSVLGMAEQFAAALERIARRVPIERRADWLVLAARLVVLRAQLLFLPDPVEAEAATLDAAAAQCLADEQARMRGAASWLAARPQLGQEVFTRPRAVPPRQTGYVALMEACLVVLRGREGHPAEAPLYRARRTGCWMPGDAIRHIRARLAAGVPGGKLFSFLPGKIPGADPRLRYRTAVASTFVAGLELARQGEVRLDQAGAWQPIQLAPEDAEPCQFPAAAPKRQTG